MTKPLILHELQYVFCLHHIIICRSEEVLISRKNGESVHHHYSWCTVLYTRSLGVFSQIILY